MDSKIGQDWSLKWMELVANGSKNWLRLVGESGEIFAAKYIKKLVGIGS